MLDCQLFYKLVSMESISLTEGHKRGEGSFDIQGDPQHPGSGQGLLQRPLRFMDIDGVLRRFLQRCHLGVPLLAPRQSGFALISSTKH